MCTGSCDEKPRSARQGGPRKAALAAALALLVTGAPARAADSFSTDWAQGAKSQARLIAAGASLAGFEIALAPGAITYWRDPGDSGLPPTLDFSGFRECGRASRPSFPAPKRIKEADGGEAFGYDGAVIFPLAGQATRPGETGDARAQRRFRRVRESLPAGQGAPLADPPGGWGIALRGRDRRRLAAVPRAGSSRRISARSRPSARDSWRLCAPHEEGPPRDLFVEPPEGWWLKVAPDASEQGRGLLQAHPRRQAEGRRAPRRAPADADRRRGSGGDDRGDAAVEVGAPRFTRQSPVV